MDDRSLWWLWWLDADVPRVRRVRHPHGSAGRVSSTARVQRYRARQQAASGLQATSYAGPWTLEDDAELLHGAGTVLDRAVRLGRTYLACCARLARLRERLETTEAPP